MTNYRKILSDASNICYSEEDILLKEYDIFIEELYTHVNRLHKSLKTQIPSKKTQKEDIIKNALLKICKNDEIISLVKSLSIIHDKINADDSDDECSVGSYLFKCKMGKITFTMTWDGPTIDDEGFGMYIAIGHNENTIIDNWKNIKINDDELKDCYKHFRKLYKKTSCDDMSTLFICLMLEICKNFKLTRNIKNQNEIMNNLNKYIHVESDLLDESDESCDSEKFKENVKKFINDQ